MGGGRMSYRSALWLVCLGLMVCSSACSSACSSPTAVTPAGSGTAVNPTTATPAVSPTPISDDPSGIGRAFLRSWEAKDYLGMYSLLSPQSQSLVDSAAFVQKYAAAMDTAAVTALHAQPISMSQENNQASFSVQVTFETAVVGSLTRSYTIPLFYSQNRWGVVWDEGLILPELAGGNSLHMDYRVPSRANIYDHNALALAYQGTVISLAIIPGEIQDETALLNALSLVLNKPAEEIKKLYANYQPDWLAPVGDITEEAMQTYATTLQPFIGKGLAQPTSHLSRIYPNNGVAPHVVGYVGPIPAEQVASYHAQGYIGTETVGLSGLEEWGEDYLNGDRGGTLTVVDANGVYLSTIQEKEPRQARSIYTTFDREFQSAVEQALAEALVPLGKPGSIVVLDVHTGGVLAMASYPTYNSTIFNTVSDANNEALVALLNDPSNPLLNRATQGAYPAGSTFKIVTFSAGMLSGLYTPQSLYTSTGTWNRLGDQFIKRDWRAGGHGTVTMSQALIVSCNSCFYDMGFNVNAQDPEFLPKVARQFGLGQLTGIVGVNEAAGLIPDPEWKLNNIGEGWVPGDAVNMAIGQGYVEVTPLQLADILAAIANGGTLYQPTVIDRIGAGGGAPEEKWPTAVRGQLPITPAQLAAIQDSLWQVANNQNMGTAAFQFTDMSIQMAGKTGTAEAPPGATHAWFAGYAPAAPFTQADGTVISGPEIAVVVMVEHAGEGSAIAAPIFRRVVELYYGLPTKPYPWQ